MLDTLPSLHADSHPSSLRHYIREVMCYNRANTSGGELEIMLGLLALAIVMGHTRVDLGIIHAAVRNHDHRRLLSPPPPTDSELMVTESAAWGLKSGERMEPVYMS